MTITRKEYEYILISLSHFTAEDSITTFISTKDKKEINYLITKIKNCIGE